MKKTAVVLAASIGIGLSAWAFEAAAQTADDFFENRVRPVLAGKCYDCHASVRRGGLRVNSLEALLAGGQSGPAIIPGDPEHDTVYRSRA